MELSEGEGNQDVGGGGECGKDGILYICIVCRQGVKMRGTRTQMRRPREASAVRRSKSTPLVYFRPAIRVFWDASTLLVSMSTTVVG